MGGSDLDMTQTDKRFHVVVFNDNTVRFSDYKEGNDLISISFKEHKDAVDCRDALMHQCDLMNELYEENKELKASLYVEKTNTAEVVNDYAKQFKRHSAQFSFMIDLAEDLGVDVRKLEALDD